MLYIKRKLFSRAIVGHHKIFNFIEGIFRNLQKEIQRMNDPTILDGLHISRSGEHIRGAYFLSGDILIKHYGVVGTAESRITLGTEFFKATFWL